MKTKKAEEELEPEQYILYYSDGDEVFCRAKFCTVDIYNRLLLSNTRASPTLIKVTLRLRKETFQIPNIVFYVCSECGRIDASSSHNDNESTLPTGEGNDD